MLHVLTIGQSPRSDLEEEIRAAVPGVAVRLRGALDGLTREALRGLAPRDDRDTLVTLLPTGEAIHVSKAEVSRRLAAALTGIGRPVLVACTGRFPGLEAEGVVLPVDAVNEAVRERLPGGRLGLFVPLPEQAEALAAERRRGGLVVETVVLRPGAGAAEADRAAREMAAWRPDLAVLDCISHRRRHEEAVRAALPCPVLLSIAVAARAAAGLLPRPR